MNKRLLKGFYLIALGSMLIYFAKRKIKAKKPIIDTDDIRSKVKGVLEHVIDWL